MRLQKEVLGAEHAYAFAIGDVLQHFHLHLVPRYADTPREWRGRAVFDCTATDALPNEDLTEANDRLREALGTGSSPR